MARDEGVGADAAAMVIAAFMLGCGLGFAVGGWLGALLGACISAGASVYVVVARRGDLASIADRSVPDVRGLPPKQALSVISAATSQGVDLRSELLQKLEEIEALGTTDPVAAERALRPLLDRHPRTPAVHATAARLLRSRDPIAAARASSRALAAALDGGMNPMAVTVLREFVELEPRLELSSVHWGRLARALRAHGEPELGRRCDVRAASDPAVR